MAVQDTKPTCFIAMPITTPEDRIKDYGEQKDHFRQVMEALFVPAIVAAGYEPVRPEFKGSAMIQPAIIRNLLDAPLVLCDMSILNANVFFELGVRSALDKPVAMVRDHLTPRIPFDISTIGAHEYDGTLSGWKLDEERERLAEHLRETAANGEHNELWRYFGIKDVASRPPEGSEMERIEVMLQQILAGQERPSVNVVYNRERLPGDGYLHTGDLLADLRRRPDVHSVEALDELVVVNITEDHPTTETGALVELLRDEVSLPVRYQYKPIPKWKRKRDFPWVLDMIRAAHGWSLHELAEAIGVSEGTVHGWGSGNALPTSDHAEEVLRLVLELDPDDPIRPQDLVAALKVVRGLVGL